MKTNYDAEGTRTSIKKKTRKTVEFLLNKPLQKCTTEPILVNREKFSNKPKFDKYFQDMK